MTVDRKSIDAMANIMQMLNDQSSEHLTENVDDMDVSADFGGSADAVGRAVNLDPGVDAMKRILESLQGVSGGMDRPVTDPELREAIVTERTSRGARIGVWEIVVNEGAQKTYDVVSMDGNTVIARDLSIYDAAYGIAKRLNEGVAINDPKIRDLLDLEEGYSKKKADAVGYQQRAKKFREQGEDLRASVAEDRLDESARQAKRDHEEILRLAGLR